VVPAGHQLATGVSGRNDQLSDTIILKLRAKFSSILSFNVSLKPIDSFTLEVLAYLIFEGKYAYSKAR
jgi:hypothetical protein